MSAASTAPVPHSAEVESSVIGSLLSRPRGVPEVVGTLLQPEHFHLPAFRALYAEILTAHYADEPIDALSIGELCAKRLALVWHCGEDEAVQRVRALAASSEGGSWAVRHAKLVKRDYDYRELVRVAQDVLAQVGEETGGPEEIAGLLAQRATQIATSSLLTHDLVPFDKIGRNLIQHQRELKATRDAGYDVGVKFGFEFVDLWTRGLRPSYLMFLAGEQGAGKSGLAWCLATSFGDRQLALPEDKRIATLVLCLEMTEVTSSTRLAQNLTGIDGGALQDGDLSDLQMRQIVDAWRPRLRMPLYFNFSSAIRASQLRALIAEAIRKHNVGLVIIDHMRYFHMDDQRAYRSVEAEDEGKAEFLHEQIAKELGVAVICLAHTTKAIDSSDDRRPRLTHLRGGGMVSAHADFVTFLYQPYAHATPREREEGTVTRTQFELIYAKNRHQLTGTAHLDLDLSVMRAKDRIPA